MSIEVIKPGLLTTLVSTRREGARYLGVGPTGAMDEFALQVGNFLTGNPTALATLEMHFPAPEFFFQTSHLVSVTGIGFEVKADDRTIPLWKPFLVRKGATLKFGKTSGGNRAYFSLHGGWRAQEWLGSSTTNLNARMGGHAGRALQKGDLLETNKTVPWGNELKILPWEISTNELKKIYFPDDEVRCTESAETDLLSRESIEKLFSSSFTVLPQSNRMGYRLEGEKLFLAKPIELISSAVDFGTIQLLPDGNMVILTADHQTTGGYPRVASIIKPDLPKVAQRTAHDKIKFKLISQREAELQLEARAKLTEDIKSACLSQYKTYFKAWAT